MTPCNPSVWDLNEVGGPDWLLEISLGSLASWQSKWQDLRKS